jgi:hypothetical protein
MKETIKRLQEALGTKEFTITAFKKALKTLPEKERKIMKRDVFTLAFLYWEDLAEYQKVFIRSLFLREHEMVLSYLLTKTVLGEIRYPVRDVDSFLKFFHIFYKSKINLKISLRFLSFVLLLVFDLPFKISTLGAYILRRKPYSDELWAFVEKQEID